RCGSITLRNSAAPSPCWRVDEAATPPSSAGAGAAPGGSVGSSSAAATPSGCSSHSSRLFAGGMSGDADSGELVGAGLIDDDVSRPASTGPVPIAYPSVHARATAATPATP